MSIIKDDPTINVTRITIKAGIETVKLVKKHIEEKKLREQYEYCERRPVGKKQVPREIRIREGERRQKGWK